MKLLRYYFNATPLFALADWLLGVNIRAVAFETPANPYTPSFVINSLISLTIWTIAFYGANRKGPAQADRGW